MRRLALWCAFACASALKLPTRSAVVRGGLASALVAAPLVASAAPEEQVAPSGVRFYVEQKGAGPKPAKGATAVVDYVLREGHDGKVPVYVDGTKQTARAAPQKFVVGVERQIGPFDEALMDMAVGERRVIVVPPELGYGKYGMEGVIPPFATLIYTLELRGIE